MKHPLRASNSARITAAGSRGRCASGCRNEGGTQTSADQLLGEVPILHGLLKLTITSDVRGFFFYSPRTIYLTLLSRGQFCPVYLYRSFYASFLSPFVPFSFSTPRRSTVWHRGMQDWIRYLISFFFIDRGNSCRI